MHTCLAPAEAKRKKIRSCGARVVVSHPVWMIETKLWCSVRGPSFFVWRRQCLSHSVVLVALEAFRIVWS